MTTKWSKPKTWSLITQIKLSENFKVLYGQASNEEIPSILCISALQQLFDMALEKVLIWENLRVESRIGYSGLKKLSKRRSNFSRKPERVLKNGTRFCHLVLITIQNLAPLVKILAHPANPANSTQPVFETGCKIKKLVQLQEKKVAQFIVITLIC
ncbi:hypothetical protein F5880DRAFT_1512202 [Lentinula raphanica]|nr:hypothetical protein F5880DRAFT_1512202 [Lentinula raphanica]